MLPPKLKRKRINKQPRRGGNDATKDESLIWEGEGIEGVNGDGVVAVEGGRRAVAGGEGGLITRTAVRRLVVISQLCYVPVLWHLLSEQHYSESATMRSGRRAVGRCAADGPRAHAHLPRAPHGRGPECHIITY